LVTNHKPRIEDTSHAIWRRVRLTPFAVIIPADKQDKQLLDKLRAERSGILNWCLQGLGEWQRARGLHVPKEIREATDAYRSAEDRIAAFFEDCCLINPQVSARSTDLYDTYEKWAKRFGEEKMSHRGFSNSLAEHGFRNDRGTHGTRMWFGIGLHPLAKTADEATES
jgi:putative DNA primase/helicase